MMGWSSYGWMDAAPTKPCFHIHIWSAFHHALFLPNAYMHACLEMASCMG
jgi:hypothetical protein